MRIEVRADNTVRICGYVNAVERESRPVITPRGRMNELIESGVFRRALEERSNIDMTVDHDPTRVVAKTSDGTLKLKEDAIGLYADAVITDKSIAEEARAGRIKGWSFGMKCTSDEVEERAGKLSLRRVKGMVLNHVTLVNKKLPVYSATSVELRAGEEEDIECRALELDVELTMDEERAKVDYSKYENRLKELEGE